jgi:tRNA dimethylallyltransferase
VSGGGLPAPRFLALVGATTSGKTELSEAIARHLDVEIVSVDSRQVYRGMEIGTDKVSAEARRRIPHHGLDVVDPDERYSAGQFARDARRWIGEIEGRGRIPLLVGGTGFFLKALVDPIFQEPVLDDDRLDRLRGWLRDQPRARLEAWVRVLDPERAELAIEGGPQRMSRSIEVPLLTGHPLSWWHEAAPREAEPVPGVVVVLDVPREELDARIAARVERMLERGLVSEVRGLLDAGYDADAPGMSATGYREIVEHLSGAVSLEEAAEAIRVSTRRYARRQITWFRHQLPEDAVRIDATVPLDERVRRTLDIWSARSAGASAEPTGKGEGA